MTTEHDFLRSILSAYFQEPIDANELSFSETEYFLDSLNLWLKNKFELFCITTRVPLDIDHLAFSNSVMVVLIKNADTQIPVLVQGNSVILDLSKPDAYSHYKLTVDMSPVFLVFSKIIRLPIFKSDTL